MKSKICSSFDNSFYSESDSTYSMCYDIFIVGGWIIKACFILIKYFMVTLWFTYINEMLIKNVSRRGKSSKCMIVFSKGICWRLYISSIRGMVYVITTKFKAKLKTIEHLLIVIAYFIEWGADIMWRPLFCLQVNSVCVTELYFFEAAAS